MKLSDTAENFMRYNTPTWHKNFQKDSDFCDLGIGSPSNCVMGELYNWKSSYCLSESGCSTCAKLGTDITCHVYDYEQRKDDVAEMYIERIDETIHKVMSHVKDKHPELLKTEREITN